jgi:hypothetical protein
MPLADTFATTMRQFRTNYGARIVWNGNSYPAVINALERREVGDVAIEIGINAANADIRRVTVSPSDFASGLPVEGDTITLSTDTRSLDYTVAKMPPSDIGGVIHTLTMTVYREALPDSATTETADEPTPGVRKEYWPVDQT